MQVSTKWLKDYIDIDLSADELAEKFTLAGIPVENVIHAGEGLEKVVTGRIEELKPHPDSDHLLICQMNIGENDLLQVLTGANNVKQGQIVPVALVGANLPCGKKISKGKLRGVVSNGMLCSSEELKLEIDNPVDGIYILPDDTPVGVPAAEIFGLDDDILEFELTANRGDCFSVIGLVRELSVLTKKPARLPEIKFEEDSEQNSADLVKIAIDAPDLCSRFSARVLTDVKLGKSPDWIVKRLEGAGMRAINNVVDATNFVMLEMGQPLHAYDFDKVAWHQLTARRAVEGEKLHTLDDSNRLARGGELVIADSEKAAGLAGIMGGFESEITESTKTVILEAANFNSASIRRTSRAVGIHTEASGRFERGINEKNTISALNRVAQLLQDMNACKICKGVVDVYPNPKSEVKIKFTPAQINQRLGTNFNDKEIIGVLESLGFKIENIGKVDELTDEVVDKFAAATKNIGKAAREIKKSDVEGFVKNIGATFGGLFSKNADKPRETVKDSSVEDFVKNIGSKLGNAVKNVDINISSAYEAIVPDWRNDVRLPEDLSEEIARIFGFDLIPSTLPKGNQQGKQSATQNFIDKIKNILSSLGMCEELSFAFTSEEMFDKMQVPNDSELRKAVPIMNPLTDEAPLLRTTLLASIFENSARNFSRKNEDVRLFEVAPVFLPKNLPVTEQPIEKYKLAGLLMGRREPKGWSQDAAQVDFYDAKGIVEELLAGLSINNYFVESGEHFALHPGKNAVFKKGRDVLAVVGEVHPAVAENLGIKKKIYVFEADIETLQRFAAKKFTFESLPKYPSISRDLAILVNHDTAAGEVEKVIIKSGGNFFKGVTLFDVYTGERIAADKKSLAFAIEFRSNERTLKDEEADEAFKNILAAVEKEFGAILRS